MSTIASAGRSGHRASISVAVAPARRVATRFLLLLLPAAAALPSSASAQSIERAKQLFEQARFADARTEILALPKASGRSAAAAYYLGRIAMMANDVDRAIRHFERAVQLEEGNALHHFWLGSAIRDAMPGARSADQPRMLQRVKREWERAVELDPDQVDARLDLVQLYAAVPAFAGGGRERAREQADEIARRSAMRGAMARAAIAQQEKDPPAEEAAYREAVEAAPDSAAGYFALADLYAGHGMPAEAFATLDRYIEHRPDDGWALYQAGRVAGATGERLDRGEAALTRFLGAPPADAYAPAIARAHYWLGQIAQRRGAVDEARERYRTALEINPKGEASRQALATLE